MSKRSVHSVANFLEEELASTISTEHVLVFRGHAEHVTDLQAGVFRNKEIEKNENSLLSELYMQYPEEFVQDHLTFDQLVRARHYGLPTRLLDVTLNPLVALYFTCEPRNSNNGEENEVDGELIRIVISRKRIKNFDSDTVSLIANLSRLHEGEIEKIREFFVQNKKVKTISSWQNSVVEKLRKMKEISRLIGFIRMEKPYSINSIQPIDLWNFFLISPKKNNKRIIAQSGAFLSSGLIRSLGDGKSTAFKIERISVPFSCKERIRFELDRLNINSGTLFPDLEYAARYISQKYHKGLS